MVAPAPCVAPLDPGGPGTGNGGSGASTGTGGGGTGGTTPGTGGGGGDIVVITGSGGSATGAPPLPGAQAAAAAHGWQHGHWRGEPRDRGGGHRHGWTPMKMACAAATSNPLSYTSGYTPDSTNHTNAMTIATAMSNDEKAQQMSGLPQTRHRRTSTSSTKRTTDAASIRGFHYPRRSARREPERRRATAGATSRPRSRWRWRAARRSTPDLEYEIGEAIGDEMLASGNTMLLAPTVNILRHPAWGRAQETYGEDMFLLGRLGSAFTVGVQQYVAACAKHYAANNIEDGRETANAMMDEQTLREIYARHFEMIVKEGGRLVGHGRVQPGQRDALDAERAPADRPPAHRLRVPGLRPLRLVGDAERQQRSPIRRRSTLEPTAQQAVNAGLDMELPWRYNYSTLLDAQSRRRTCRRRSSPPRRPGSSSRSTASTSTRSSGVLGLKTPFTTYDIGRQHPEQRRERSGASA